MYTDRSFVERGSTVTVAVSLVTAVPCSERSVRSYVPGESGSVSPATDSTLTPDPVETNSEGDRGVA
ncbi:hypothetical protein C464_07875 [Halorubrum coriense DSM 10284]|uniref:Uncharacterized protein n=1 Tax=Halorubrum coriense DSM 10284 TaxID=1227466 RepID=M0EL45_9EURY|nr:hypothetical protein C464_07875 [Halorubrum coriense DSM 10284]